MSVFLYDGESCCGPQSERNDGVVAFAAATRWLREAGVEARRFTLSAQPEEFMANDLVASALQESGMGGLPILVIDGQIRLTGRYPSTDELVGWAGVSLPSEMGYL